MDFSSQKSYNICIVSEQLAGGGAERCSAILSQFFYSNNCKVHHVIVIDKIEYNYAGEILNLGKLKKKDFNLWDRIHRFSVLYHFFKTNKFDFIIDTRVINRQFQEIFIFKFIFKGKLLKMVHSYMTDLYFPKNRFLARNIYSHSKRIITVSLNINEKVKKQYNYEQVDTIYNPIDVDFIIQQSGAALNLDYKFVLAVGNFDTKIKQFDKLIFCYSRSNLPKLDIKLIIIGDGLLKKDLIKQVFKLNLEDKIIFKGTIKNPFPYYKAAIYTILTSKNEGFPTVLLESLACQTPVIAYDCLSGPSEIIINNENGILVENQNEEKMISAMNEMNSNNELYLHCKKNSRPSIKNFSMQNIGIQWLQLFNSLA